MPAAQQLLFADPQPLVERFGREFFRRLPETAGVYLMRDAADVVLYVGKAKNLRKRLGSYRVANPDRMPLRHLRMLRSVVRIEVQECSNESAALARESELLKALRPKFNRAGTWHPPPRYLAWRSVEQEVYLTITQGAVPDWNLHGPVRVGAVFRAALARVLWIAAHSEAGFVALPVGWASGRLEKEATIHCGSMRELIVSNLKKLLSGAPVEFCDWIRSRLPDELHPFQKASVNADLEFITETSQAHARKLSD